MSTNETPYTWDEISQEWLGGHLKALGYLPQDITDSFNQARELFGREWVELWRATNGVTVWGTSPTLHVFMIGQQLASVVNAEGAAELLEKLRQKRRDAFA